MATKEQYEFFKSQYEEENVRNNELTKRAEIYLSIISIFLTGILLKLKDIFGDYLASLSLMFLFIIALAGFSIALLIIINSLKIRDYEGVINVEEFIRKNDETSQENDDFFDDRIADYIVAVERNEIINNHKADLLIKARMFIASGFITTIFFIITLLIFKYLENGKI